MERIREQTRERVAAFRERQKQLADSCNVTETLCNEIELDKELDIAIKEKI